MDEIGRIAEKHGARVLVDEVYLDTAVVRPGTAGGGALAGLHLDEQSDEELRPGGPPLRLGSSRPPDVAEAVRRARDIVDGSGSVPDRAPVGAGLLDARPAGSSRRRPDPHCQRPCRWGEFLASRPDLDVVLPQAGTVVFPRIRGVQDAGLFVERLARAFETDVVPGRFFQAPAHFRVAFGGRADVLAEGLAQIGKALDTLSPEP